MVDWNCKMGPLTSERFISNKNGATKDFSIVFERAPASKDNHGASRLSLVTHNIPKVESSNSLAMSTLQRAPLSISSEETYGSIELIIYGSHSLSNCATLRLLLPDQLINTFIFLNLIPYNSSSYHLCSY